MEVISIERNTYEELLTSFNNFVTQMKAMAGRETDKRLGEWLDNTHAYKIVEKADIFAVIGTSLQVYPAAGLTNEYFSHEIDYRRSRNYRRDRQNFLRLRRIPRYIIDPSDFDLNYFLDFEHIKTTAVEGVDILKEKLKGF